MARGEIYTVRVDRIAAGGAGIARFESPVNHERPSAGNQSGKSIFIELSAPGDLVKCRIKKEHKNWAEAELLEILEPSSLRITPVCPLYGRCGGCSLQHLNYEAQIDAKTTILSDSFKRIGHINPPAIRIRSASPFEYRNRVQFHKINESQLGFKERKSSRLVALEDCPVAESGIRKALKEGKLAPPSGKERFTVYSHLNTFLSEGRQDKGRVSILGKELMMDVRLFFQSNAAMLELLITDLISAASGADQKLPLADIYCGVGTFASFLGSESRQLSFKEIDLVEENKSSLALARENMPAGKKVNCYALSDTMWVKTLKESGSSKPGTWGFMVLDPPREGLSAPLREWLAASGPELAAYVSCDPATLARDSKVLVEGGYMLKELTLYDFYPQTAHIESLAIFSRVNKRSENPKFITGA